MNLTDRELIDGLLRGDEAIFEGLIQQHHAAMLRVALMYLPDVSSAEEVIQETWIHVLKGIHKFEERSSLKTWIFSILMNRAKTLAKREGRYVSIESDSDEAGVAEERFYGADHPHWAHHWAVAPENFPEEKLISAETLRLIQAAIATLPPNQREVITLRDIQQWTSEEVCQLLNISESNQRVLLHRARSKVRQALESYFKDET